MTPEQEDAEAFALIAASAARPAWRLLTHGDTIQRGDEGLNDDCETWHVVTPIFRGMPFNPGFFVPIRRRVEVDPTTSQGGISNGGEQ